jgi:hypothetical protein
LPTELKTRFDELKKMVKLLPGSVPVPTAALIREYYTRVMPLSYQEEMVYLQKTPDNQFRQIGDLVQPNTSHGHV